MGKAGLVGKLQAEGGPALAGLTDARGLSQQPGEAFRRHLVANAAMLALGVVQLPERTGDYLRLQYATDQLPSEAVVPEASIEALDHAVLRLTARLDEEDPEACLRQPFLQCTGHELTPVVAPQVLWRPMGRERRLQRQDHLRGPKLPVGDEIDAVMSALVDDRPEVDRRA